MRKNQVSCGDRYVKQNPALPVIWVVDRLVEAPGLPSHVRLVRDDRRFEMCTVSLHALNNRRFFKPLAP